jgi:hypothetical protein
LRKLGPGPDAGPPSDFRKVVGYAQTDCRCQETNAAALTVVANWTAKLKRKRSSQNKLMLNDYAALLAEIKERIRSAQ